MSGEPKKLLWWKRVLKWLGEKVLSSAVDKVTKK